MSNYTYGDTSIKRSGGTTFIGGLTEVEFVVVGTVTAIALLGIVALILRVTMPRLKQKRKERTIHKKAVVDEKNGNLVAPGTPISQMSRASSRQSTLDDWTDSASDNTKMTYYSQASLPSKHAGLYGNFRLQAPITTGLSVSSDRINDDLISVLSNRSTDPLEPLNLASNYRENWDNQFSDVTLSASTEGLCYISHPSENPDLASERYPTRLQTPRAEYGNEQGRQLRYLEPYTRL
ncbi:uncharacterized protein LOC121373243 [Gigantopelta aegis]|uniref:uncharacterized protein LOC121373243 n=1 Tax=Gigantopelta aegis TaxID=1735272 RepID=UPI001B88B119|nr:uncharacterized protein LOC121373243 [Gigantopelta aegis]XP_041355685.1 uncharacterized protein LOC121373243 [Gigantopelta aegis]XP_041355686.1 uncharacterized protein LOC121373243 [Gigantopelta aegis]